MNASLRTQELGRGFDTPTRKLFTPSSPWPVAASIESGHVPQHREVLL
jgi:hypothetical protein